MYDGTVFEKIRQLVPSGRGELEITDVNNAYIREGTMTYTYLEGWWTDAGTFDSLLRAQNLVARNPKQTTAASGWRGGQLRNERPHRWRTNSGGTGVPKCREGHRQSDLSPDSPT